MPDNKNISEDMMADIITLVDEDNKEHAFEIMDHFEYKDNAYVALVPYFENPEDALKEDPTVVFFRVGPEDEEGLETFDVVEDDEEYYAISGIFEKRYEKMMEEIENGNFE
ncbi:MAG: DUF1292 domain-containing protein [Ruminococcaceae bacterium]|nr:DUF1292 domain-containing protein [Oscillospiraceae bacterium]